MYLIDLNIQIPFLQLQLLGDAAIGSHNGSAWANPTVSPAPRTRSIKDSESVSWMGSISSAPIEALSVVSSSSMEVIES